MADIPQTSRTSQTHPSWYPRFLYELETRYPDIFTEITSDVIGRNAVAQVEKAADHG